MPPFSIRNTVRGRSVFRVILPVGFLLIATSFLQGCTSDGRGHSPSYYGSGYSSGGYYHAYNAPRYNRPLLNSFGFGHRGGRHGGGGSYSGGHR